MHHSSGHIVTAQGGHCLSVGMDLGRRVGGTEHSSEVGLHSLRHRGAAEDSPTLLHSAGTDSHYRPRGWRSVVYEMEGLSRERVQ